MDEKYIGYIQLHKKLDLSFSYDIDSSPPYHALFLADNAIAYSNDPSIRYSSVRTTLPDWSICFKNSIIVRYYAFQEPYYGQGSENAHQKSWIFFGSRDGSKWTAIDSRYQMKEHNQANYFGKYNVNDTGPFLCVKIQAIESHGPSPFLTFRNFDIFEKESYFRTNISLRIVTLVNALFYSFVVLKK